MDLTLGPEQEAVRDAIRGVLADRAPLAHVRRVMVSAAGDDPELWHEAAGLGWFGLGLAEGAGGAGYGVAEEMLLFVELGRALTPGAWIGTVLAAHALGGHAELAHVLAGARRVAVIDDPSDALGAGRLAGEATAVADAGLADALLVLGGTSVHYLAADASGVRVDAGRGMDAIRRLGRVRLEGARAERLAVDAGGLRLRGGVLTAAEAVGVAERALEMSVAYAKVRQQFGRPIGSFQAVKHRCADMAVRTEAARSAVTWAAVALAEGDAGAAHYVHVAKTLATDAALVNAGDNVQNHGGMGYTWEADAHLYLKRAWVLEHTFGRRAAHLDALAAPWRA